MLTAGALALAVIAPAVDSAEPAAEARQAPPASPANPETTGNDVAGLTARAVPDGFDERLYQQRQSAAARATRATQRRAAATRPAPLAPVRVRPAAASPPRRPAAPARRSVPRGAAPHRVVEKTSLRRTAQRRTIVQRRTTVSHRGLVRTSVRRTVERPLRTSRGRMGAVLAYARSQLGRRYVSGGEGRSGFDCSGLTRQAYARAGVRLPHSSRGQAARARTVPRGQARPGDLVVGRGHVGIYMGRGMMIDAGNHRTGVVYRKVYRGLKVKRLH
ncbi:C40 family peptidase [Actinoplanes siamensis]|uniref:NlpC/P60 domain-containing protein n=1 Tax=Actinoplanes siamensis TaxID=1223317 RepID=A0A919TN31_9ACTN|nr:C40 family peptidase [Actinoplanes siamensis]GIF07615.1 hypothetical protein Asi03nite_51530 [Actinoplanes siamensis]